MCVAKYKLTSLVACSIAAICSPGFASADTSSPSATPTTTSLLPEMPGYKLIWHDEFDVDGKPNPENWSFETGFMRNHESQYYQSNNASVSNGVLKIEGRRELVKNEAFDPESKDWRKSRQHGNYTASCLHTRGKQEFQYGILEVRAKIDTAKGLWPAIWTLGVTKHWPSNGEIDIMEFFRIDGTPHILANAAWKSPEGGARDTAKHPFSRFLERQPDWSEQFHTWRMLWTEEVIKLYLDGELLNVIDVDTSHNPDGFNGFKQPHYLLLNLAIGSNGGDPAETDFPQTFQVDYVRLYQKQD